MKVNFEVELLPEAFAFIKKQDFKTRKKIFQNLNRAKQSLDPALFKKLNSEIWEFRTKYNGAQYRLLAFWDKQDKVETIVFATHGFKKKTDKVAKKEILKAEKIRIQYFKNKS
jgi:phage-related protein